MFFRKIPEETFEYNGKKYTITGFNYDDDILKRIRKRHTFYEIEILEFIASRNMEGVYIDIGANIGNHTIFFCNECPSSRVISFECYDKVYDLLKANCERNIDSDKLELNNVAVTSSEHAFVQPAGNENIGQTKIVFDSENSSLDVNAVKLDSLMKRFKDEEPVLIKIDVEGNELDVLKSGENLLKKFSPAVLVESMWDNFVEVNDFMLNLNYSLIKRFKTDPNLYYYIKKS